MLKRLMMPTTRTGRIDHLISPLCFSEPSGTEMEILPNDRTHDPTEKMVVIPISKWKSFLLFTFCKTFVLRMATNVG